MEASGVTKHEGIEKLLNRFGQTISDLPIDAYRKHFLDAVINRMEIALQTASERIDDIRETAVCMGENCRPYEDQRDAGFDDACMEIVRLIDSYNTWNGDGKSAD